jgi:hypothetical protein
MYGTLQKVYYGHSQEVPRGVKIAYPGLMYLSPISPDPQSNYSGYRHDFNVHVR